jgi:hypothetical protein
MHAPSREWRTRAAYGLSPADVAAGVSALAADYEARRAAGREDEAGIALVDEMGMVS